MCEAVGFGSYCRFLAKNPQKSQKSMDFWDFWPKTVIGKGGVFRAKICKMQIFAFFGPFIWMKCEKIFLIFLQIAKFANFAEGVWGFFGFFGKSGQKITTSVCGFGRRKAANLGFLA